jgi:hypothetical protein
MSIFKKNRRKSGWKQQKKNVHYDFKKVIFLHSHDEITKSRFAKLPKNKN